jgi:diguanylate cyclase (GGDEF)-like protein/PAS domain S-box-containing protein
VPSDIPDDDGDLGLSHPAPIGPRPDAEHARLSLALEASTDLVLTATRGDERIRMNPAAARILADSPDVDPTTDLDSLLARTPSWVRHRFLHEAAPALEAKGLWEGELSFHDRTGATIPLSVVMVALRDGRGEIETVATVARDITERKEFEQRLAHQATHDPLTGLPNRTLLVDRLHMAMARGGRTGRITGVLFLDLDNFKVVNDSLGHSAGDTLLVEVARRVQAAVRPGATVARFGGDEFVVLCEELERAEEALEIARRIEEAIAEPVSIDDTEVTVTASIGVATSEDSHVAEAIVRDADAAMYEAKARGRSRTEMFDSAMHVQAVDRLALESSLRRALERHEMRVAYQPQIDLGTGRIIDAISGPFGFAEAEVYIGASIGIAFPDDVDVEPETFIRDADAAMYQAKERGRGRWVVFDNAMRANAVDRLDIENALRRSIERRELRVHYQPVVSIATGHIVGVEALLRWEHPERGLLLPGEFIGIAEETGLIVPIGAWVLEQACRQVHRWEASLPDRPNLSVAVNLSGRQLSHPGLVDDVAAVLGATGVDPGQVELEITESVLMDDVEMSADTLGRLKQLGVRLSVDDFGTRYSSLSYLRRFPVDLLKVDRSFVDGLGSDPSDSAIVEAIITLAQTLGLEAVAEGVETEAQLAELRLRSCDLAQGYLLARPAAGDLIAETLVGRVGHRRVGPAVAS